MLVLFIYLILTYTLGWNFCNQALRISNDPKLREQYGLPEISKSKDEMVKTATYLFYLSPIVVPIALIWGITEFMRGK